MEKYFGEKQERFSFRKLSVGLVSATISSLFFMSVLGSSSVEAQETKGVHYKYVTESELSSDEKKQLVYDIPTYMENDDETYYLVYKLNSQNQLGELPNTGSKNDIKTLVAGASLAALGILIFAVSKKKVKNKTVLHLVLVAGIGNGVLVSAHALENNLLLNYNTDYELTTGEKLPLPKEISGYTYIGYIKEGKTTSDFEVSNQEKSAATPTKQQKVDYNVTPNFVDHPSTVQAIQEQTPVSSTKPTEVQVVEKPFSTELINPRKEEKQSSDSQEQLAEHKNLETKKEEKISPKEKTGVNTLNPQDEVLSGQLNKPELLYREETIETKIDFQEEIQENPDLAEGTVRVKQEGKLGKKVEIVRIFSVNKEEVPVNPNEGTVEGTSNQETENPVQPAEESTTNSEKVSPDTSSENTGEVSNKPSDSKPPVEESNQPEKNGTATKPENSGNTTSENGQTEPEPSNGNSTEDVSTKSNTSNSNGNEEIKQENELDPDKKVEDPEKTLELRNVSDLELYSLSNGTYKQHISLEQVPSNPNSYFVKVKSSSFKDVYLPVASISEERKNDKILYKITAKVEKLQQEIESRYKDNFTFYLAKKGTEETTNFTSFSNLVKAINQNLSGTYHLGASLNANEVELSTDDKSYIKGTFTGQLIGEKDGKHYAIYNLKKPLFESLRGATIEKLSLKNVSISGKDDIGSLANEAQNNTKIKQVHVDGVLAGERGIGGLLAKADQSSITESSFKGRIVNTYETTASYNIGGLVGHLTGSKASLTKSKATVVISSNTNSSDQTVGGIAGLVDKDAHIQNSYSEGDINNSQRFGKVAGIAGNLWDRESNSENHAGRLTNVLSDVNVTNGNAISGYHWKCH
ncbi:IgA-protease [Streptococcus pneumoniae]|nr:IgA-protease [Streptococcus pneumoniae]